MVPAMVCIVNILTMQTTLGSYVKQVPLHKLSGPVFIGLFQSPFRALTPVSLLR